MLNLHELKCPRCGGELRHTENIYNCLCCGKSFESTADSLSQSLTRALDDQKSEQVANLRQLLWREINREYVSDRDVSKLCNRILAYLPDDFYANFYLATCMGGGGDLAAFLNGVDTKLHRGDIPDMLDYLIKGLKPDWSLCVGNLIERAYKGTDLNFYNQYRTRFEEQNAKVEEGVFEPSIRRDVFIAYSSADMSRVEKLVEALERENLTCFVAARNLRHGSGAADSYKDAIQTAIKSCIVVVFVSSDNSRDHNCDAYKEINYISANRPDMLRVQYLISDYCGRAAERNFKDFFDGLEYCTTEKDVAERVIELKMKGQKGFSKDNTTENKKLKHKDTVTYQPNKELKQNESLLIDENLKSLSKENKNSNNEIHKSAKMIDLSAFSVILLWIALLLISFIVLLVLSIITKNSLIIGSTVATGIAVFCASFDNTLINDNETAWPTCVVGVFAIIAGIWCGIWEHCDSSLSLVLFGLPIPYNGILICLFLLSIELAISGIAMYFAYRIIKNDNFIIEVLIPTMISAVAAIAIGVLWLVFFNLNKITVDGFMYKQEGESYTVVCYNGEDFDVNIPSEVNGLPVTTIQNSAFNRNSNIRTVSIPESITHIGSMAFYKCNSLTKVSVVGDAEILDAAFAYCSALDEISLSENVSYIGANVFYDTAYYLNKDNWTDGVFYIDNYLIKCSEEVSGSLSVKEGTTLIGYTAILNCDLIESITIPESVIYINKYAVYQCDSLRTIYCGTNEKLSGWHDKWNKTDAEVIWGYNTSVTGNKD